MELFTDTIIQSEAEAYILGFLFGDGYVTSKKKNKYYSVGITLSLKDKAHLIKINEFLVGSIKEGVAKLKRNSKEYNTIKLFKCDVNLVQRLISLGIKPNKTYELYDPLEHIHENMFHHFIRGYFDADGTICKTKEGKYVAGIVGLNSIFIQKVANILSAHCQSFASVKNDSGYIRFCISGNSMCIKLRQYLYNGATIFLQRKRDIFDSITVTNGKHGYKGISYNPSRKGNKWCAKYKKQHLGLFETKEQAVERLLRYINELENVLVQNPAKNT